MKTEDINVILKEFASMSITPSENWDLVFQNKLYSARLSKSNTMLKCIDDCLGMSKYRRCLGYNRK
jgi:hypothetical protein